MNFLNRIFRWYVEIGKPDANGRWRKPIRRKKLLAVWERDDRRCGLCGGDMPVLKGAHLEHVVPKRFPYFTAKKGGTIAQGTLYKSRLHSVDNLQAAHPDCNKRKGNSVRISDWRHRTMEPLKVADHTEDGTQFVVPFRRDGDKTA